MSFEIHNKGTFIEQVISSQRTDIEFAYSEIEFYISFANDGIITDAMEADFELQKKQIATNISILKDCYSDFLDKLDIISIHLENNELVNHLICEKDKNRIITLNFNKFLDYSLVFVLDLTNEDGEVIVQISIANTISSNKEAISLQYADEYTIEKLITYNISELNDDTDYEHTFFKNVINTDEHMASFTSLRKNMWYANMFLHNTKGDHHACDRITYPIHTVFKNIDNLKELMYTYNYTKGPFKPSIDWTFEDAFLALFLIDTNITDINKESIKRYFKNVRIINNLLRKFKISPVYTTFGIETGTLRYCLINQLPYNENNNYSFLNICFDIGFNTDVYNLSSILINNSEFTLKDYLYHSSEVVDNIKMIDY